MRILDFVVSKQKLRTDPRCDFSGIASGTRGYLYARFRFSADWKGCKRVAVFSCNGREEPVAIVNGMCEIPAAALVGKTVKVWVVGQKNDYRITTNDTSFEQATGVYK